MWLAEATAVATALDDLFIDDDSTVFSTGSDAPALLVQPGHGRRHPVEGEPGRGRLLRLSAHTGDDRWANRARAVLGALGHLVGRHPLGFGDMLERWR